MGFNLAFKGLMYELKKNWIGIY